jgi:hypothetical protein
MLYGILACTGSLALALSNLSFLAVAADNAHQPAAMLAAISCWHDLGMQPQRDFLLCVLCVNMHQVLTS